MGGAFYIYLILYYVILCLSCVIDKIMGIPEFLDSGRKSWTMDSGLWTLDAGLWTLDAGLWTLDAGLWTLDAGHWTLEAGLRTLNARLWTLKPLNLKLSKALETLGLYQ